jgi:hypothetical protein
MHTSDCSPSKQCEYRMDPEGGFFLFPVLVSFWSHTISLLRQNQHYDKVKRRHK